MTTPKSRTASGNDWRTEVHAQIWSLIEQADPHVREETKWRKPSNPSRVPVWSHHEIICTGESHKGKVKLTFVRGAALSDPAELFNAGMDGKVRRAMDLKQGGTVDENAFQRTGAGGGRTE